MKQVVTARVLKKYSLELTFDDGVSGPVDLGDLAGKGVFRIWDTPGIFEAVRVGPSGELAWGQDVDLCPDSLYLRVTGMKLEDLFPSLQQESAHA
jgi:hypothetical protein